MALNSPRTVAARATNTPTTGMSARGEGAGGAGVLDREVMAGLRDLREPGQPDPLKDLIALFLKDAYARLENMAGAFEKNDAATLVAQAHSLKGSARNLGAVPLAQLCASLEKAAKLGDLAEAANLLLEMRGAFEQVKQALLAELET